MEAGRALVLKQDIKNGFRRVGIEEGDCIIVHASLHSFGYVCGGEQIVIEALMETVGTHGTIMMPTQTWKNLDPEAGVHWEEPKEWWQTIRDNWPAYDKNITPTNSMGKISEMFRKWPGTVRSDHPARSLAAWGEKAAYLVANHDLSDIFGETSPIGKFYQLDGKVVLMGVGYDKNTSLHLADVRADYPGKHYANESSAMMAAGKRQWVTYNTLVVDGEDFQQIGKAFEKDAFVKKTRIGDSDVTCMRQRAVVDFAVQWIEKNRR